MKIAPRNVAKAAIALCLIGCLAACGDDEPDNWPSKVIERFNKTTGPISVKDGLALIETMDGQPVTEHQMRVIAARFDRPLTYAELQNHIARYDHAVGNLSNPEFSTHVQALLPYLAPSVTGQKFQDHTITQRQFDDIVAAVKPHLAPEIGFKTLVVGAAIPDFSQRAHALVGPLEHLQLGHTSMETYIRQQGEMCKPSDLTTRVYAPGAEEQIQGCLSNILGDRLYSLGYYFTDGHKKRDMLIQQFGQPTETKKDRDLVWDGRKATFPGATQGCCKSIRVEAKWTQKGHLNLFVYDPVLEEINNRLQTWHKILNPPKQAQR